MCMIAGYHGLTAKDKGKNFYSTALAELYFSSLSDAVEQSDFVLKIREVLRQWSDPCIVVTRYLFFFLQDLAKYRSLDLANTFLLSFHF